MHFLSWTLMSALSMSTSIYIFVNSNGLAGGASSWRFCIGGSHYIEVLLRWRIIVKVWQALLSLTSLYHIWSVFTTWAFALVIDTFTSLVKSRSVILTNEAAKFSQFFEWFVSCLFESRSWWWWLWIVSFANRSWGNVDNSLCWVQITFS